LAAILIFMLPVAVYGQETTSTLRVTVLGPDGNPAVGETVTITDTRTGSTRTNTSSASGVISQRGLNVGGPYNVVVSSDSYANQTVTDLNLRLGETYDVILQLGANVLEEVIVTAAMVGGSQIAMGPSSVFGIQDLENLPAINRDLRDIIQQDPRIYIDLSNRGAVHCAGANPRFNSLTVDGTRMNDNFGLNANGYPTENPPFPFDAIQEVAVQLAPFDVEYGGFTACNINAVTKSGANQWHGSAFFDYTSDDMTGDELQGEKVAVGVFTEKRWGATVGGPIIKDKLFFFLAYEYWDGANTFDRGPAGSDRSRIVQGVSVAQFEEIQQIAQEVYDYDPGGVPLSIPNEDEKFFARLDWNISDNHRLALIYNWNDGFNVRESDADSDELEFEYHLYERGAELTNYSGQLFSDWTDNFSTEAKVSYTELDNRQISINGIDFGEAQITTFNDHDGNGIDSRATVYLGADDSRHANKLYYETLQLKLAGTYIVGRHMLTGGFEQEGYDVFNMFIQEAEGEYRFSSIDDFRNGTANRVTYENAPPDNIKTDAGRQFQYKINTVYLQDEFIIGSDVTIVAGLRYDWYTSGDVPSPNEKFEARYGFSNSQNMDGKDLLQPRLGFNWNASDQLLVHGGVGLFSGGNPNVWISNNYSNDGHSQVEAQDRSGTPLSEMDWTGSGRPIWDIPQHLWDAVATGTADSDVNAMDPDFDIPANWKINLGFTYNFGADMSWALNGDIIYSKAEDSAIIVEGTMEQIGVAPDGRPIYRQIDRSDPDCANPTSADCSGRRNFDFILTNVKGSDAKQTQIAFGLGKSYFDAGVDWFLGYAYTKAEDVNPMTSSVAFSNFVNVATADPNDPGLATTNYRIPHRFTARLNWQKAFFGDNLSKLSLFFSHNQGRPYSYTFAESPMFGDAVWFEEPRSLLYVPSGPDDPNVVFADGFDTTAFFNFVEQSGLSKYSGQIAERNAFKSNWWTRMDLRLAQEFSGFREGHKFEAFLIVENLTNLINSEWGVLEEVSFPLLQATVGAYINSDGKYVFEDFIQPSGESRVANASLWKARIGLSYRF